HRLQETRRPPANRRSTTMPIGATSPQTAPTKIKNRRRTPYRITEVRVGRLNGGRREIHRLVKGTGLDTARRSGLEDHAVVVEVHRQNGVVERLADVQRPGGRVVDDHADSRCDAQPISPTAIQDWTDRTLGRETVDGLLSVRLDNAAVGEHDAEHR